MKNIISSITGKITQYFQLRYELVRLELIERLVSIMGYFAFLIIAIFLAFFFGFFMLMGMAEWLNDLFNSRILGHLTTAGFILIFGAILVMSSKKVIAFFIARLLSGITKPIGKEKKENADDEDDENL